MPGRRLLGPWTRRCPEVPPSGQPGVPPEQGWEGRTGVRLTSLKWDQASYITL